MLRFLPVILFLILAACSTAPTVTPTSVGLTISGAPGMNGGAPAQVKVFYLKDAGTFRASDFFALFDAPEATLGSDLVSVSEFQLAPGRTVTDSRSFAEAPAHIGIVAAFRDINGRFLAVRPLAPATLNPVSVTLDGNSVTLR